VPINCPIRNQKAQACNHQAHPCQSLYPWCLERVAAQVHVLLEPCYILATCSKLWSISGNVYFFSLKYGNFVVFFTKRPLLDSQPFSFVAKWPYLAPKRTLFTNRGLSFQFCDIKNLMKISNKLENSIKFTVDKQKSYKKNLFMKIIYICIHSNDQKSQIHFMPATWWFFQFF
jgi:hypothetical protein